jgi:LacI family transcriptional regulator, gluconate utilization system Gnt-I transcriptional repressor
VGAAKQKRTTLSDVAARAAVSAVTVSRALRKPEMVSLALRERIESAVRELAYIPNQLASALASARTHTVGALIPSLTNSVFADYLKALHDTFKPAGLQVLVLNTRYDAGEEETALSTLLGQHPEAMILAGIDQTEQAKRLLRGAGIPVVQTMELTDDPVDINIGLSQRDAGYAATRFLLDLGHRKIGHITARLDPRARRRVEGYRQAMADAGIDATDFIAATPRPSTTALGAQLFGEILSRAPDIEAIFTCNDDLALGVLFECQRRGIRVPGDVSLIGFNDLEVCASAYPALSSVATPRYEMGRQAAEIVLEIIRGSGTRPPVARIDVGFKVVARASTAPRPTVAASRRPQTPAPENAGARATLP